MAFSTSEAACSLLIASREARSRSWSAARTRARGRRPSAAPGEPAAQAVRSPEPRVQRAAPGRRLRRGRGSSASTRPVGRDPSAAAVPRSPRAAADAEAAPGRPRPPSRPRRAATADAASDVTMRPAAGSKYEKASGGISTAPLVSGTTTNSQVREPTIPSGVVRRSLFAWGGKTLAPGTASSGPRSIHFRLPVPSTRKRSVAASPSGTASRSRLAAARKRPTAPAKPGASGSGSTSIDTGLVARSILPPASKKPVRARPTRNAARGNRERAGLASETGACAGPGSAGSSGLRPWRGSPAGGAFSRSRSSTQKPANCGASLNWRSATAVCV